MKNKQDYYSILGVEKNATEADLKKAYRALGKKYHPDVNPDKEGAAAMMQDINEAYETLSDPKKRAEYDSGGSKSSGGSYSAQGGYKESHDIFDDIFSGMKGKGSKGFDFGFGFDGGTKPASGGSSGNAKGGAESGATGEVCKRCGGKKRIMVTTMGGFGTTRRWQECPVCGGKGKV